MAPQASGTYDAAHLTGLPHTLRAGAIHAGWAASDQPGGAQSASLTSASMVAISSAEASTVAMTSSDAIATLTAK